MGFNETKCRMEFSKDVLVIHVYLGLLITRNLISFSKIAFSEGRPCEKETLKGNDQRILTLLFHKSHFGQRGIEE